MRGIFHVRNKDDLEAILYYKDVMNFLNPQDVQKTTKAQRNTTASSTSRIQQRLYEQFKDIPILIANSEISLLLAFVYEFKKAPTLARAASLDQKYY